MEMTKVSIGEHFADIVEPRVNRTKRPLLRDIIVIAICNTFAKNEVLVV